MKNKFSIIIITLNEEENIKNILDDLSGQTKKNFEVIIVDSKSEDNTKKAALKYKKNFSEFSFIEMKKRWASLWRNTWGKNSKYKNLLFLDADTRLDKDFIEKLDIYLKKHKDISWATFFLSLKTKKLKYKLGNLTINGFNFLSQYIIPTSIGACFYVKKEVFNKIWWFNEKLTLWEDSDFSINIWKKWYKFRVIPISFYFHPRRFEEEWTLKTLINYAAWWYYLLKKEDPGKKLKYNFWHYKK